MCKNHSSIIQHDPLTDQITIWHGLTTHHEKLIRVMGLSDAGDPLLRQWARAECVPPYTTVRIDEQTIPAWCERLRDEIDAQVIAAAQQAGPLVEEWDAAHNDLVEEWDAAVDELAAQWDAARDELDAKYRDQLQTVPGATYAEVAF